MPFSGFGLALFPDKLNIALVSALKINPALLLHTVHSQHGCLMHKLLAVDQSRA